MSATKEQIENVVEGARFRLKTWPLDATRQDVVLDVLYDALTAAEKERDKGKAWIAEAVGVLNNEAKYLRAVIDVAIKNGEGEFEYCIRRKLRLARLESLLARARGE